MEALALSWDWGAFVVGVLAGSLLAPVLLAWLGRAAPDPDDRFR